MLIKPPPRTADTHGMGHYHAPRGNRLHNGIDVACWAGSEVLAIHPGKVTKLGYPYADKPQYRYVQVTDPNGRDFRYFYVEPGVRVGDDILQHEAIGIAQDLQPVYPGITPHIHVEIKDSGDFIDPTGFVFNPV